MSDNYVVYHLHSDYSLLDSCTKFEQYVDKAVELGQTAIASTEHGNIFNWVEKKEYCDQKGIKYIHGCEVYLTHRLFHKRKVFVENKKEYHVEDKLQKIRDNYHTVLLAKNYEGIKELNTLVSNSTKPDNFYFKPRITFDDFLNISDNIISTSACLASFLWSITSARTQYSQEIKGLEEEISNIDVEIEKSTKKKNAEEVTAKLNAKKEVIKYNISAIQEDISDLESYEERMIQKYTYLEVQPHVNSDSQKEFNKLLVQYHYKYNIPLIAGTDTHSIDKYKAECRTILQIAKGIEFLEEDEFDLTYKSYDEIYDMFVQQGVLSEELIKEALDNTVKMADSVEDFTLDKTFKYPIETSIEADAENFTKKTWDSFEEKVKAGIIDSKRRKEYEDRINEELTVLNKVGMGGFMLSMSNFIGECRKEGVPLGFARGSCFTKDAIVSCQDGAKTIDKVQIGDMVLAHDGKYHKVTDTQKYNVFEPLVEFHYIGQQYIYRSVCTFDHQILVHRNNKNEYIYAFELKVGDRVCCPRNHVSVITNDSINDEDFYYYSVDNVIKHDATETTVYDLTVEDVHNFILNGIVVHNCAGCLCAFLTDITDLDAIVFKTNFARFCNEDRVEAGDEMFTSPYIVIYRKQQGEPINIGCAINV